MTQIKRPEWANQNELMQHYYDDEWGLPVKEDQKLFEMLSLETYQAGLSWLTVLKKRMAFRQAFYDYDINKVAQMSDEQISTLLSNKAIIRNQRKLNATVNNAKAIQQLSKSFTDYVWSITDGEVIKMPFSEDLPAQTELSKRVSKQMKKDGFNFVGPVTVFSFLLAVGVVNARI
ncbi:DNA-3-methyladenine glycosylase I [Paucilactobacillus sp. N302-9]